jgi:hypothetical protein
MRLAVTVDLQTRPHASAGARTHLVYEAASQTYLRGASCSSGTLYQVQYYSSVAVSIRVCFWWVMLLQGCYVGLHMCM